MLTSENVRRTVPIGGWINSIMIALAVAVLSAYDATSMRDSVRHFQDLDHSGSPYTAHASNVVRAA